MNQDTENFHSLRRLLAVKRHEVPPPGYFNTFSRQVILRIKAGESGRDRHGFVWQALWLQRLWSAFESRPVIAAGLGLAMCSLAVFGVVSSDNDKVDVQTVAGVPSQQVQIANDDPSGDSLAARPTSVVFADASPVQGMTPTFSIEKASLFDLVPQPKAQQSSLQLMSAPQ